MKYVYLLSLFILACNLESPSMQLLNNGGFEVHDFTVQDKDLMVPGWRPIACEYTPNRMYVIPRVDYPGESMLVLNRAGCGVVSSEYDLLEHSVRYYIHMKAWVITDRSELSEDTCQGVDVLLTWFAPDLDKWGVSKTHRICPSNKGWKELHFAGEIPPWATLVRLSVILRDDLTAYVDDVALVINP